MISSFTRSLNINDRYRIDLHMPCDEGALGCYDQVSIFLNDSTTSQRSLLYQDFAISALGPLIFLLEKTTAGTLLLPASMKEDIGYLWNEHVHSKQKMRWEGLNYALWESEECDTWLYNNNDGKIVFEVSPAYPWHFDKPQEGETCTPYHVFIKNYQPLALVTIDQTTANEWLKTSHYLMNILQDNETSAEG